MASRNPLQTGRNTIRLDYGGMMSASIGNGRGIADRDLDELSPAVTAAVAQIKEKRESSEWGFFDLPYDTETAESILALASSFRNDFDNLAILGIGGSILGGIALFHSLCHPFHNLVSKQDRSGTPRVFFVDNIDPSTLKSLLAFINPDRTLFNVISKSGSTVETVSRFLVIRKLLADNLGERAAAERILITTGETGSPLREVAEKDGHPLLAIPDSVGGRFSVFSPVGLFPAAMAGIDIDELLEGARYADERCRTEDLKENPACMAGALHYLADTKKGLTTAVMMPYSDALVQVAYWFRQLWAESLGKAETLSGETVHVGQNPVVAAGAIDQHSQLQLYAEGPFDKMITFVKVETHADAVKIPETVEDDVSYLAGRDLGDLLNIEAEATRLALTEAGRSNMSLVLPEISPFTIGQLLYMLQVQTVFAAGLYNVDPVVQPGVEMSKRYIYGMTGREGFSRPDTGTGETGEYSI